MATGPRLIVQVPRGGAVDRQFSSLKHHWVQDRKIVVEAGPTDAAGDLVAPDAGKVVLSVPSPETLAREREEVLHVLEQAGSSVVPLVVVVEAAEELRDEELRAVLEAAEHSSQPVILRIIRDA